MLKKLNIPTKDLIDNIRVRDVFVIVDLITIEELQYYLDKDSEGVYFWFSEEMEYSWRRKLFVGSF